MIGFTSPSIAGKERRRPISAELLVVPDFSVIEIAPSVPGYVLDRSSGFFVGKCLLLDRFLAGHTLWRMKDCPFCYHTPSGVWLESSSALALWDGFPIGRRESPSSGDGKEFLNRLPGAECQINGASNVISVKPEEISR